MAQVDVGHDKEVIRSTALFAHCCKSAHLRIVRDKQLLLRSNRGLLFLYSNGCTCSAYPGIVGITADDESGVISARVVND